MNSAGAMPVINGDESYDLFNASGTKVDGRTIAMTAGGGSSVRRKDPCLSASAGASWTVAAASTATP